MSITLQTNAGQIADAMGTFALSLNESGKRNAQYTVEEIVAAAKGFAHVGPDPTYPKGRPHTRDTVRYAPLNSTTTRISGDEGALWEEARGGDHAFLSRAVDAVLPGAKLHWEGLVQDDIQRITYE